MDSQQQQQQQQQSPSLQDCLKLLKGERDEQQLAGLLLVTKFCNNDDHASLRTVYNAIASRFLDRLLRTGMGKGIISAGGSDNRDAYLQLSVTVLAAFCRLPEIASSEDMVLKIPLILEIMSNGGKHRSGSHVLEECYEILYLVSAAREDGVTTLYEYGGMKVLASQISCLPDGSHAMELAMKLVQLMLSKVSLDIINNDYISELAVMVNTIARQFAVLHNAQKFEALHLLCVIFSSKYLEQLHQTLCAMGSGSWSNYIRVGIVAILQNRVAPAEKLQALILAETMVSVLGEEWLISQPSLPDIQDPIPANRCLLLILETSRVEAAVLLNELAYLNYEASKSSSSTAESILSKQQNLAVAFSLVERIIKLLSRINGNEGNPIDESTSVKMMNGLNEMIGEVLEYLQDAKEHAQKKGNDLLASVRIVGSYLAETPISCKQKVKELLDYMLLVEGEDEPSPFYSICFLLPMLCQITMEIDGCRALASSGGYKAVVGCLIKLVGPNSYMVEDDSCIFLACDTVMNLLLKKEQLKFFMDQTTYLNLLKALAYWAENKSDPSSIMVASTICVLILDYTSEEELLNHPNFDFSSFIKLSELIAKSLASCGQDISDVMDLYEIIDSGYSRWGRRFPRLRETVERTIS
ncbi:Neurochondrin domain-containing protein [Cephalotus follicularis]|uniref:Neurochondrin domain-containing protein n=1 Tax=Cephalotus follicularis TaxID=3775 RepID=A0A1Q3CH72_CEPFO|nr:Neurochondrin domain-containing protein [Cephalotus follicularis]